MSHDLLQGCSAITVGILMYTLGWPLFIYYVISRAQKEDLLNEATT